MIAELKQARMLMAFNEDKSLIPYFISLFFSWPAEHENLNQHAYVNKSTSYFYESMIHRSAHSNFMDIPYMIPVKALSQAGEIYPDLAIEISTKLITSFFDRHLKTEEVDLNSLNSEYEALDLKVFKGDSVKSMGN